MLIFDCQHSIGKQIENQSVSDINRPDEAPEDFSGARNINFRDNG